MTVSSARALACKTLCKMMQNGAYSNIALDEALSSAGLQPRDAALATMLTNGAVDRKLTLDYNISLYLKNGKKDFKKLKPQVVAALEIGAYQLLFTDKIPHSAAINESVQIVKNSKFSFASGLCNAVLRRISENGLRLPDENAEDYFEVKYSFPRELVNLIFKLYGKEKGEAFMDATLKKTDTVCRINRIKADEKTLSEELAADKASAEFFDKNAFVIKSPLAVSELSAFKKGMFFVQDTASQICAESLMPLPGESILDVCSAPGGKSFALADLLQNTGKITSCDIYEHKLALIESGAKRLGIDIIKTALRDGAEASDENTYDKILCDVPCSGLGVIGKKPEIKYKKLSDFEALPDLQLKILENNSRFLKKGGTLVYSTCTVNRAENEGVVESFLKNNADFYPVPVNPGRFSDKTAVTLLPPGTHSDGFFIAKFKRKD